MGNGYWNREAYVNEGATFDPGYAHQENSGTHHYHANPVALRYQLGDHVDFDETTRKYRESTAPVTRHSPILGWVRDGFPVYGPYAFSEATNATSALRRMTSGFQLRNGQRGADNPRRAAAPPSRPGPSGPMAWGPTRAGQRCPRSTRWVGTWKTMPSSEISPSRPPGRSS